MEFDRFEFRNQSRGKVYLFKISKTFYRLGLVMSRAVSSTILHFDANYGEVIFDYTRGRNLEGRKNLFRARRIRDGSV